MISTQREPEAARIPGFPDESKAIHGAWIATTEEFRQLSGEWLDLFRCAGLENVFLSFEWMFTWWKHWGKNRQLAIITVRDAQNRLVALAPFCIGRSFPAGLGARRLSFLADTHVGSDYLNILTQPGWEQAAVEEIGRMLFRHRREWDYIELRDAEDAPLLTALCAHLEDRGMALDKAAASVCHHTPLPASFEEYLAGISSKLRSNFRYDWRAIQREGQVEFIALSNAAGLERYFPDLLRLHSMRFEQRKEESAFLKPGVPAFHMDALEALAARGWARLFLLRVNGETASALYGFSIGKTFQFYQCGMHTGWLRRGVGQLMIGTTIQEAIRTGHRDFDFLRGDEPYKARWAGQSRRTVRALLFDRRPASLAAWAMFRAASAVRRWSLQASNNGRGD